MLLYISGLRDFTEPSTYNIGEFRTVHLYLFERLEPLAYNVLGLLNPPPTTSEPTTYNFVTVLTAKNSIRVCGKCEVKLSTYNFRDSPPLTF